MYHDDKAPYAFDYESGASSSYLVLKLDAGLEIMTYQIEMISYNRCSSILPVEKRQVNGKVILYYNITSLSTVENYLKRKKLGRNDFIAILRGIIKAISGSKRYLLNENGFIIDERYIFINPATMEIALVYVPLKSSDDINNNYKAFVSNIILNTANLDEGSGSNAVSQILNYLRQDCFNLAGFDRFLEDISGKRPAPASPKEQLMSASIHMSENVNAEEKKEAETIHGEAVAKAEREIEKPRKKAYKRNNLVIAGLVQILVVIAAVLVIQVLQGIRAEDRISTAGGAAIILGAADFLLLRKLLDRKSKVEDRTEPEINMSKREIYSKPGADNKVPEALEHTLIQDRQEDLNTVIMEESANSSNTAYLKSTKGDIVERIAINKESFIIGRLKDHADYISSNNAVGKVHAELILREGHCFIKDLNSKNGTRLNGERISSNVEYEMKNNDKVAFADSEYVFVYE